MKSERGKRGRPSGKGNELDGFLKFAIGGKHKWRRYAIFKEFLVRSYRQSEDEADATIIRYQRNGVSGVYQQMLYELKHWLTVLSSEHASKAGIAKAKKYRKWSKARRQRFLIQKFDRLNKKEGLT